MHFIHIYTDGSCLKPNGPSGWAFIGIDNTKIWQFSDGDANSTNNRMELTAVIEALDFFDEYHYDQYYVYTDSKYVINGITEWINNWKLIGWKKVKNVDLWKRLDESIKNKNIKWQWVKAHNGDKYNEIVDLIAKEEAKKK